MKVLFYLKPSNTKFGDWAESEIVHGSARSQKVCETQSWNTELKPGRVYRQCFTYDSFVTELLVECNIIIMASGYPESYVAS
jgi:hypothetical protein